MILSKHVRLVDGPLTIAGNRRAELVEKMAADLLRFEAYSNKADAMRALLGRYPSFEITVLVDDARQAAMQEIVAREMSEP